MSYAHLTFSRELSRHINCTAEEAQIRYQSNKSNCWAKLKLTSTLKESFQEELLHLICQTVKC